MEIAKSGRGRCEESKKAANKAKRAKKKAEKDPDNIVLSESTEMNMAHNDFIGKGEIRLGSLDEQSGSYTRWHHLACWRVPAKVWMRLQVNFIKKCYLPLTSNCYIVNE